MQLKTPEQRESGDKGPDSLCELGDGLSHTNVWDLPSTFQTQASQLLQLAKQAVCLLVDQGHIIIIESIEMAENHIQRDYSKHIHKHTYTHTHLIDIELRQINNKRLEVEEDSSMEWKTWQVYCFGEEKMSCGFFFLHLLDWNWKQK